MLYASHPDFEQTNVIGELGEGTGGVTEPLRRRIVLPLGGPLADTDHVIGHELVHAFQFDMTTGPDRRPGRTAPSVCRCGSSRAWPSTSRSVRSIRTRRCGSATPPATGASCRTIDRTSTIPKYFPYRWGQAFWAYVGGRWGDEVIGAACCAGAAAAGDTTSRFEQRARRQDARSCRTTGRRRSARRTSRVLAATTPPSEIGQRGHRAAKASASELNVGPAISPDGSWIAFLSERSVFSIDLFIADAATGKIVRKLTSTASDPHFSSIQFIYSAGAWDAPASGSRSPPWRRAGRRSRSSTRRAVEASARSPIAEVDEIFNPTWAPDGHAICFTGMTRGLTDLFIYDLTRRSCGG